MKLVITIKGMKAALCFIISYQHILNKENIWKDWIEYNKDIINVYFHYKDIQFIRSPWIKHYCIPNDYIAKTSYYHVVPAYISILSYAFSHDNDNKWFCLLTESCVPIISPQEFRSLFFENYYKSIFKWKLAYWNIELHQRANLKHLKSEYHLANDPWFTLTRKHVHECIIFTIKKNDIYQKVCKGGLANESLFAIILQTFKELDTSSPYLINQSSTISDWSRMSNATSPHLFLEGNECDLRFIKEELLQNKYTLFLRKVDISFPDTILLDFIKSKKKDNILMHYSSENFIINTILFLSCITFYFFFFHSSVFNSNISNVVHTQYM